MKSIIREGSTAEQVIEKIERFLDLSYREKIHSNYSYSKEFPYISDVCDFLSDVSVYPLPIGIELLLIKTLTKDRKNMYYTQSLTDFIAKRGSSRTLMYLILVLEYEREELKEKTYSDISQHKEDIRKWRKRKNDLLAKFDAKMIKDLESLISLVKTLESISEDRYGSNFELNSQKKFLIIKAIVKLLRSENISLTDHFYFLFTYNSTIVSDLISVVLTLADAEKIKELKKQIKDVSKYGDKKFISNAEVLIAHYENAFAEDIGIYRPADSITQALSNINAAISSPGIGQRKTWINDPYLESILHKAVEKVDDKFSQDFTKDHASHEPVLTGHFLRDFEAIFKAVTPELEKIANASMNKKFLLNVKFRDTQPQESEWNADIAFLLKCVVPDKMLKTHAVLVQCKKMRFDKKKQQFIPSWNIDINQCKDLLEKSASSVYFLYGPDLPPVKTQVVPAQAVLGVISANLYSKALPEKTTKVQLSNVIELGQLTGISHTLADFFLYDFINCWIGDEFYKVVMIADGIENVEEDDSSFQQVLSPRARNIIEIELTITSEEN